MAKRIGLLTGGGDAPGQNVCLKAIVYNAIAHGFEVIGIRKGWEGLLNYDPDNPSTLGDNAMELTKIRVRDIDRTPGSYLHSSRVDPSVVVKGALPDFLRSRHKESGPFDLTDHVKRTIEKLQLEALIVVGDRNALIYAARLSQEGIPVIGVPKTVNNDVTGSDYAIGFSSALGRGVRFIQEMRAMASSREEIAVIETLGDTSGLTTMLISFLAGADRALIPEVPFDPDRLAGHLMEDQRNNPTNYAILVMSEVAQIHKDALGKYQIPTDLRVTGNGPIVTQILEDISHRRMVFQPLSYLIRTGEPDGQDFLGAMNFGIMAVHLISQAKSGRMTVYRQRESYTDMPLDMVCQGIGNINVADHYDDRAYTAKESIIWAAKL
jgi:ATP-dependent phosphofructokinase / diphosphate-dependent phosphofructokinase